jgi:hypothetical protein
MKMEATVANETRWGRAYLTTESAFSKYNQPVLHFANGGCYTPGSLLPSGIRAADYLRRLLNPVDDFSEEQPPEVRLPLVGKAKVLAERFIELDALIPAGNAPAIYDQDEAEIRRRYEMPPLKRTDG